MSEITKRALAHSLKNLMNTKPLSKIKIKDIVKDCRVNRRTFYYHFQDIYDLLEWIFKNEIENIMDGNKTHKTWQEGFLRIFSYLNENHKFVVNTYNSIDREKLEIHLYNAVYVLVSNVINEVTSGMEVAKKEKDFVANFYKVALVGLLLEWIRADMSEKPQQIIDNLNNLIGGSTYKALMEKKGLQSIT